MLFCFFFFKQKTAYEMRISDWSSDVCSSDLGLQRARGRELTRCGNDGPAKVKRWQQGIHQSARPGPARRAPENVRGLGKPVLRSNKARKIADKRAVRKHGPFGRARGARGIKQ